ncbi:BatD family protein [Bythopirellula goksoeyrii]|uniref:Tetratricopeptide repeat protein n=1 Tax=Bythopirellula goksoeyrii TaxID=1400387 RepID=A0A5B9QHQ2_9BACT|nr:BatD family protein [Bythopirellula goksoeyrii]QEG37182.1 Tetratricopeptide repeat protein [Bythopirellula goksoeyrii]
MQHFIQNLWRALLLIAALVGSAIQASAGDVRIGISSKETYVGLPVVLQVQVNNATSVEPPVLPKVEGLEIQSRGTPSQSTQIMTVNGRTTRNMSLTYLYDVVPQRTGSFRIPPISIEVDGKEQQTPPFELVASESETGDLMFVEVAGKQQEIYVGQALDLTLKIWLRPFRDVENNIVLSDGNMWQMISPRSNWGVFADRIEQMAANRQRPKAQEVLRKDREGAEHSYYLYEIDATIYPKHSGKIDADDLRLIVEYPTALGRARDPFASMFGDMPFPSGFGMDEFPSPFGRQLTVQSVRPIVADATVESIDVRSILTADRPADYRGAVGDYHIVTEAQTLSVKAGDPIELLIGIVGTGPMELVQAPPLAELPKLTADFKVPSEPLAGFVQDDRKVFSTTIRPRKEGITEIPAIPFTFFDPQQEKFVTVHSKPISIHVDPADTLALDAIVGSRAAVGHRTNQDDAASSGLSSSFQNDTDSSLLNSEAPRHLSPAALLFLFALPPLVVCGIGIARNRNSLSLLLSRLGWGSSRAQTQILEADSADSVSRALQAYLVHRLGLKTDPHDTAATLGSLRAAGHHKLAVRCERVFLAAHQSQVSGVGRPLSLEEMKHEALELISELRTQHEQKHAKPTRWKHSPEDFKRTLGKGSQIASLLVLTATIAFTSQAATAATLQTTPNSTGLEEYHSQSVNAASTLTVEQQQAVLAEASHLYESAMDRSSEDSADAKQAFANAAEKYQMLVDSGIANSRLYVNLANAYLQSGQQGQAIANYKRALAIDPANSMARTNLERATEVISQADNRAGEVDSDFTALVSAGSGWLARSLGSYFLGVTALAAWLVLWLVIGLKVSGFSFPWKSAAVLAAIVAIVSAVLYANNHATSGQTFAIITSPSVTLREGDGQNFPATDQPLREGQEVELVKHRGAWLKVRSESGQIGWVPAENAEVI